MDVKFRRMSFLDSSDAYSAADYPHGRKCFFLEIIQNDAVREWSIDFVKQSHINNARNWMVVVCY